MRKQRYDHGRAKNRIDSLWEIFWIGGPTDPLDVIAQITCHIFIHGQVRNPGHIIRMTVDMMAPRPDELVCK